ncbi:MULTISPECIES: HNH endonuclease signature motif containing protein [Brevibacterium]|nr:HNH endonuclease signature motif containing protein [Brevibacterium casei]
MTLTPNRKHPTPGNDAAGAHTAGSSSPESSPSSGDTPDTESLFDQLTNAGIDLTGNPLADTLAGLTPTPPAEDPELEPESTYFDTLGDDDLDGDDANQPGPAGSLHTGASENSDQPLDSDDVTGRVHGAAHDSASPHTTDAAGDPSTPSGEEQDSVEAEIAEIAAAAAALDGDTDVPAWVSRHPLFTGTAWADLTAFAPEVTTGITTLMHLDAQLRSFDKPMGPDEALLLVDGAEALSRVSEALSILALSVYDRVGTPAETGAKDTKSLIQDRLNLTRTEAHRRAEMAKNLGGRVDLAGQALKPLCPEVSEALHTGALSAGQAKTIDDCLAALPDWVSAEQRADVEKRLVAYAPTVRVSDIRAIFNRMLGYIDPDGKKPVEETPRSDYAVTMRPKRNGDWVLNGLLDPVAGAALNGLLTSRIKSATETTPDQDTSPTVSDSNAFGVPTGADADGSDACGNPGDGVFDAAADGGGVHAGNDTVIDGQESLFDVVDSVLRGDRFDAPLPTVGQVAAGHGSGPNGTADPNGSRVNGMTNPDGSAGADTPDGAASLDGGAASGGSNSGEAAGESGDSEFLVGVGVRADGSRVDLTAEQPTARAWIYERFATLVSRISMDQAGAGTPYALVVTATAEDLAHGTGEGTTGVETPIPIGELQARGLNGQVFFHLVSQKAKTVQVLTEKRFANKQQIAVVTARDKGCTFPGCDAPPGWCDANHVIPHARGGRTEINNLALACSAHHHLMDRSEWEMRMMANGRPAWVPPAAVDPAREPIFHPRFLAEDIITTLFDDLSGTGGPDEGGGGEPGANGSSRPPC